MLLLTRTLTGSALTSNSSVCSGPSVGVRFIEGVSALAVRLYGAAMQAAMFVPVHKLKILKAVICLVAVDVVNVLVALKSATQLLFHHIAVFADIASYGVGVVRQSEQDVAVIVGVSPLATLYAPRVVTRSKSTCFATQNPTSLISSISNGRGLTAPTFTRFSFHASSIA